MLRYVLLALMADGRSTHGYALMKAFAERSGVHASIGNVYRYSSACWAGLIVTVENPAGADTRRAPYVITAAGRAALAAWLAAPAEAFVRTAPDAIVYRLALVADVDAAQAASFLDDLHAELASQLRVADRELGVDRIGRG
jgi:DNA-binding PadR family transcriptional regulator